MEYIMRENRDIFMVLDCEAEEIQLLLRLLHPIKLSCYKPQIVSQKLPVCCVFRGLTGVSANILITKITIRVQKFAVLHESCETLCEMYE